MVQILASEQEIAQVVSYSLQALKLLTRNFLFGTDPAWPAIIMNPAQHSAICASPGRPSSHNPTK